MRDQKIKTAESCSPKHPDKVCDFIADSILDAYLEVDKNSRVACEVMGGHKLITINGEITSEANGSVSIENIVRGIVGNDYKVIINTDEQSPEIARGVDTGGAGDQGIMIGYATSETQSLMPKEYETARYLCQKIYEKYPHDGKVQVAQIGDKTSTVVASFQNSKSEELLELVRSLVTADKYHINPAGEWHLGGFEADAGLSGRKIVVDAYGPNVPVGGGSFSGKDPSKVDRSGAYMARKIAVDLLKEKGAKEVLVKLAYVIGEKEPVMAVAYIDDKEEKINGYNLTPAGIREFLKLTEVEYKETAKWGHFGRNFNWDR